MKTLSREKEILFTQSALQAQHDVLGQAQRWGWTDGKNRNEASGSGCYGGLSACADAGANSWRKYFYAVFHGDGPEMNFYDLRSQERINNAKINNPRPFNKFEGTERTIQWVQYLLSEHSPWKALHPFIVTKDVTVINNSGFIFTDLNQIPRKLLYNFLMAIRFPWEVAEQFALFLELGKCIELALAAQDNLRVYIANHFALKEGAKSLDGPYICVYPWSYLEGLAVDQPLPFLSATPLTLARTGPNNPNIESLWGNQGPCVLSNKLNKLGDASELTLPIIIEEILSAAEKQRR